MILIYDFLQAMFYSLFLYILIAIYSILIPFTIYEYNIECNDLQEKINKIKDEIQKLKKERSILEEKRKELEEVREIVKNDYEKLEKEKELFSKKFINNFNISTWSDEEDWSENNIE